MRIRCKVQLPKRLSSWTRREKREKVTREPPGDEGGSALFIAEVPSDRMESVLTAIKQSLLSGGNWAQLITRLIAPLLRSMAVAASRCGKVPISLLPLDFCFPVFRFEYKGLFGTMSGGE